MFHTVGMFFPAMRVSCTASAKLGCVALKHVDAVHQPWISFSSIPKSPYLDFGSLALPLESRRAMGTSRPHIGRNRFTIMLRGIVAHGRFGIMEGIARVAKSADATDLKSVFP